MGGLLYDGTTAYLRRGGTQVASGAVALNTASSGAYVGSDNGATFADIWIGEIILTTNYLSGTTLTNLETNLKTYWGL